MPRGSFRRKRIDFYHHDIPTKANRILNFILIAMVLILVRIWHLSVIQYDQRVEDSQKPQRKTVIEPAIRATIRDRFNIPLAINKMSYQAALLYSQLKEIPSIAWEKDSSGNRVKIFKRKTYIHNLSQLLAKELNLDAERVEDLIHAKASYYSQVPFVLKDDLTEQEYYRLKMLEKDWPGLHVRYTPKRHYPKGRVGADVIGYMGAINKQEHEKILQEMSALQQFIRERENGDSLSEMTDAEEIRQARKRLRDLEAKAYTVHDYVGKTGIEGVYEEQLRGFYGKKNYTTDSKGNFLKELPDSRPPLSGHRILLSLSGELQEYAEQLLAQNEELRIVRQSKLGQVKQTVIAEKTPWIKGGAIVVMDPSNGEILTLASYPRFDPNDFILSGSKEEQKEKKRRINRWFENETFLAQVWNNQVPLEREHYRDNTQEFYDEKIWMTWKNYLNLILPAESQLRRSFNQIKTIGQAVDIQRQIGKLQALFPEYDIYTLINALYMGEEHDPFRQVLKGTEKQKFFVLFQEKQKELQPIKKSLDPYFNPLTKNYNKVLLVDLCRLCVADDHFSKELLELKGNESLDNFHDQAGALVTLMAIVKEKAKQLHHEDIFSVWRKTNEKEFLKTKRDLEKLSKSYPKPYIDYLDQQENAMFHEYWEANSWNFLLAFLSEKKEYPKLHAAIKNLPEALAIDYLKSLRPYDELTRPLLGKYRYLRKGEPPQEKHLAAAFYPAYGFGYGRSHAYRQAAIQGSLFKLVTAYEALVQRYRKIGDPSISHQKLNPLVIVDRVFKLGNTQYVGYTEDGKPIPQLYKGGRLPRSLAHLDNGRVDLLRALEVSSNPYFSLLAGESLEHPNDLSDAARLFSFGSRTGIDLPSEIPGKVPTDLETNRTGLYAMAIGQHSLVVTPLQTAVMLATIANGGKVLKPKLVKLTAGREHSKGEDQIVCKPSFPLQEPLSLVGIDFPLFTALSHAGQESLIKELPTEINREIFLPEVIRQMLLKGLKAVSLRAHQESLSSLTRLYRQHPEAVRQFAELKDQILGKTSTSESVENLDLDLDEGTNIYTHVWFGSLVFQDKKKNQSILLLKDEFGQPELIVVVYLRYGGYGKEAAPLAAQMVKKWRELKEQYN